MVIECVLRHRADRVQVSSTHTKNLYPTEQLVNKSIPNMYNILLLATRNKNKNKKHRDTNYSFFCIRVFQNHVELQH